MFQFQVSKLRGMEKVEAEGEKKSVMPLKCTSDLEANL